MMNFSTMFRTSHKRPRFSVLGTLSVLTLTAGVLVSEVAHANPPGDIAKYTKAARQIELQRRGFYNQIKGVLGGDVPDNVCRQGNLPAKAQEICKDFEEASNKIVRESGMDNAEFNALFRYCRKSPKPQECPP